jgi:hypothetical protein
MSSIINVNQRLLKIFGLEGQRVTSLTVHTEVDAIPTLTTKRLLINVDGQDVRVIEQVFDLVPRQQTAARPECEAMARVNAWIETEAGRCRAVVDSAFSDSWVTLRLDPWRLGRYERRKGGHAWISEGFSTPQAWRLSKNSID